MTNALWRAARLAVLVAASGPVFGQVPGDHFVRGLAPDWNQPRDYPDSFDALQALWPSPGSAGPVGAPIGGSAFGVGRQPSRPHSPRNKIPIVRPGAFWNAWCVPASAAMMMGHWEDKKDRTGLSDASADGNLWQPGGYLGPTWGSGPQWHDYTADGAAVSYGPHSKRGSRGVEDLGFYLDTNGKGVYGTPHVGTTYSDTAPGPNGEEWSEATGEGGLGHGVLVVGYTLDMGG